MRNGRDFLNLLIVLATGCCHSSQWLLLPHRPLHHMPRLVCACVKLTSLHDPDFVLPSHLVVS